MKTLTWIELRRLGRTDSANRWFPSTEIVDYFDSIRSPSRAWPHSYAKAAMTKKFAAWLILNRPEIAEKFNLNTHV